MPTHNQISYQYGTMIDLFTASAIVQVYDALNDANKGKFASLPAGRMGIVAFKLDAPHGRCWDHATATAQDDNNSA
jgi:hypothetical protein